jgi:hypothetical protein
MPHASNWACQWGSVLLPVTRGGRVWGRSANIAPSDTIRCTPQRAATSRSRVAYVRHRRWGSRPRNSRSPARPSGCQSQNALRGQRMVRSPSAVRRMTGRTWVKSTKSSRSIAASGSAASWRTRNRIASVAASPASIQPLNAVTIVGMCDGGSRCHATSSMLILLAGKRDASCSPAAVTQNPSTMWHTRAWHYQG